ncbi:hypothetical protein HMPREF9372_1188 [Sporosarcina newyorkensis 2681]|uniref:Uncharacterized protein n=1 Tax=Sporosarcina newyorkensis 2681 TaxID=1027292 RepID=F9DQV8_9BACL|nr:hypothetical protein HMPREF9372_1188 [Sporosarcina newyorkensis 2681]
MQFGNYPGNWIKKKGGSEIILLDDLYKIGKVCLVGLKSILI